VQGGGLGGGADGDAEVDVAQVAGRSDELELVAVLAELVGGVEELGAGGVAAGAGVVVGRVPTSQPDEQHGVDSFGDVGVAEPDRSRRSAPRARIHSARSWRVSWSSTMTVSVNSGLPCRNSWPPDLGAVIAAAAMSLATWRTVSARSPS
jgi:hypothetical protein